MHRRQSTVGLLIALGLFPHLSVSALDVTWISPANGDAYGNGDILHVKWTAESEVSTPSFRLCMSNVDESQRSTFSSQSGMNAFPRSLLGSRWWRLNARRPQHSHVDPLANALSDGQAVLDDASAAAAAADDDDDDAYQTGANATVAPTAPTGNHDVGSNPINGTAEVGSLAGGGSSTDSATDEAKAGAGDMGSEDWSGQCGTILQPPVTHHDGYYATSLSAPSLTQSSTFYLEILDASGGSSASPSFILIPSVGVDANSSPAKISGNGADFVKKTHGSSSVAALVVPLVLVGLALLAAGTAIWRQQRKAEATRTTSPSSLELGLPEKGELSRQWSRFSTSTHSSCDSAYHSFEVPYAHLGDDGRSIISQNGTCPLDLRRVAPAGDTRSRPMQSTDALKRSYYRTTVPLATFQDWRASIPRSYDDLTDDDSCVRDTGCRACEPSHCDSDDIRSSSSDNYADSTGPSTRLSGSTNQSRLLTPVASSGLWPLSLSSSSSRLQRPAMGMESPCEAVTQVAGVKRGSQSAVESREREIASSSESSHEVQRYPSDA